MSKFKKSETVYFYMDEPYRITYVLKGTITITVKDLLGNKNYNIQVNKKNNHFSMYYCINANYIFKTKQLAIKQWDKCVFQPAFDKLARLNILRKDVE